MKTAGKTFSCPWFFTYPLLKKRTVPLEENSGKRKFFIDGKHSVGNFNTPDLHRFSWLRKSYVHKEIAVKFHSNK